MRGDVDFPRERETRVEVERFAFGGHEVGSRRADERVDTRNVDSLIVAQGGDGRVCDDVDYLPHAAYKISVPAPASGYVARMDTAAIGRCAQALGAGRQKKTDVIDPAVGLVMDVRLGDEVKAGDSLATLYLNRCELANGAVESMQRAITIAKEKPELPPLIHAAVSREGVTR